VRGKSFKSKKKTEIRVEKRLRKGKQKKVNLGWHRDRKESPISAPSIQIDALVGAGSLWAEHATDHLHRFMH